MNYRRDIIVVTVVLVAITYDLFYHSVPQMTSQRKYTAQHGFFSHDEDPESWGIRPQLSGDYTN